MKQVAFQFTDFPKKMLHIISLNPDSDKRNRSWYEVSRKIRHLFRTETFKVEAQRGLKEKYTTRRRRCRTKTVVVV